MADHETPKRMSDQMELVQGGNQVPVDNQSLSTSATRPQRVERDDTFTSKKKRKAYLKKILLVWIVRLGVGCFVIGCFLFLLVYIGNGDNWKCSSPDDQIQLARTKNRGVIVSVLIAILLNIIGAFMFYIKVKEHLVVTNYGFILGPVIGFMLDIGIATTAGCKTAFTGAGFKLTFASLIGGNFMRYIVTVFLDLFISNPLQDVLKRQAKKIGVIEELKSVGNPPKHPYVRKYDLFLALNFPSILQSVVAFVTFNAYTNQTRFAWAYPDETLNREYRIPPGTIMLSTAIAGVLYLNFYTIMDLVSKREYFDVNTKLIYVLVILGLLYGLNQTESIEAPVENETDNVVTAAIEDYKPALGFFMFTFFVLYGFVYPIWTRLGCFGYCKPTPREIADTDHLIEEEDALDLSDEMREPIRKLIAEELAKQHAN